MKKLLFSLGLVVALLGATLLTRTQAANPPQAPAAMSASSYKITSHAGTFVDISTNPNAVALGAELPDGTDLWNYFWEPTEAGGTTVQSKKVTTSATANSEVSEFCFPLGFDFKISGKTMRYFLVSALGGAYFSPEPTRLPLTSAPGSNSYAGNCIFAELHYPYKSNYGNPTLQKVSGAGYVKKVTGKAPAYYLIEGTAGNRVLTTQHHVLLLDGDEWLYQFKFYEATNNFELVVGSFATDAGNDRKTSNNWVMDYCYGFDFGLFEIYPGSAANDTVATSVNASKPWQLGIPTIPSSGSHKWFAGRYYESDNGWNNPAPFTSSGAAKVLQIKPDDKPEAGRTIRFNYPECQNPLPAIPESDYSVSKNNQDNAFTATIAYKPEALIANGVTNIPTMGTIVAVSSASPDPDFTLENGTFYFKGHTFAESEGFVPTVLCNQMPAITATGNPPVTQFGIAGVTPITLSLTGLAKFDSRYIHIFRMSLNCDGRPVYSPLCFTIAREPILDPPALLETVGMPTVNSVKLHAKPADGLSVMIIKSKNSINISPKGQLKKGSKIGTDAEVVDVLDEEKTWDVPMTAGEGCYFVAITVNTSNANKYAYSPANRLWCPARAAYNGLPGLLDMSQEPCGIPNKENDGMKLTTPEWRDLEPSTYRDLPLGWTRENELANNLRVQAFGLGHPGYDNRVPVAVYARITSASTTDAITVPILANKNRIAVTYQLQIWRANSDGGVSATTAQGNDQFEIQYALGTGAWQSAASWTGNTLPAADENGVYNLKYSLINDNLKGQYIRFRFVLKGVVRTDNNGTCFSIKALEIKEDKLCQTPTNLQQTISQTATTQFPVTWTDPNPTKAASYLVTYRRSEATGDWSEKTVTDPTVLLSGLRSSTTYAVYVKAVCGEDEESYPTDTTYFTTAYTFPYSEPMAQRDTVVKIQGSNATVPTYSPFPGKPLVPRIPRRDGGVNTYTGQLPNTGNANITLAKGDGSNTQVFCHAFTYNKVANVKMDDGNGVERLQLKAVGVGEQANYAWVITPVIYTVNLEENEPLVVRFKARSAARSGSNGPWTKGSVGNKYSAASLKVLVSNTGDFSNSNVVGTVNVGTDKTIDGTEYEFDLTSVLTGSVQVAFYYANTSYVDPNSETAIENNSDWMTFEIFDVRFEYKNDVSLCPPLEGLERVSLTPHSATYEWAPSDSAKYYDFTYGPADSEESGEGWHTVKLTKAEYTIPDLQTATTYKIKVTGYCDAAGENAAPDPLEDEFTTPEGCTVPTGFKVQDVTYYGATFISQQTQPKLEKREVYVVATNDNSRFKYFTQTADTLVQEKGLSDNMPYTAKTRAICRYGVASADTSEWSSAISFTTPVDPANLPDTLDVRVVIAPAGAGSVSGARKYVEGEDENITLTATPNAGYLFKAWVNTNSNDTVSREATYTRLARLDEEEDENDPTVKTHVLEFRAVFRKVYTITLNTSPANGGTVTGAGTYDEGKEVALTATPANNYLFVEWQDAEGGCVSTLPSYKVTPTADVTYTAVFRVKERYALEVDVTPDDDWGSVTQNPTPNEDGQYVEGVAVTLTAVPSQYCTFVAWKDVDGNTLGTNASYTVSMDNNKKVVAEFAQIRYQVTLKSDPNTSYGTIQGTSGSTTTGGTFVAGTTRKLTAQPKSGYEFVKWMSGSQELGTNPVFQFVLTRDTTITAYFKEKAELDITVNVEPAGAGTVAGAGKVKRGENAVLTATPAAHYAFKEWRRLDNTTIKSNPYTFTPDRDYTFTAVFRNLETYTVTVTQDGNGSVTGAGSYEEGSTVTLTAMADEHYHFAEWQDEAGNTLNTNGTYTFTVSGNTTVKAVFNADGQYQVSLTRMPSAGGVVTGAGKYYENDEVTLTATPNKGYTFLYWEKADGTQVTDNPYMFNALAQNMSFTAVFEAQCEIKVTVEPEGAARVTGAGTYAPGDEVTLTATVDDEYVFEEWRDATSGITLNTENPYTFTAGTSTNIKAVLREKAYYHINVPYETDDDEDENDPGTISIPGGNDGEWKEGTTVTMTATPAQYYTFVEWRDVDGNSLSTNPVYSFVISQDTTFTAVFSRIQYKVTLISNPDKNAGTINGTSGSVSDGGTFDAGSTRHLTASPKSGYEFEKWMSGTVLLGTNPELTFILTRDTTITAYFKAKDALNITVTVDPANAGTVTGAGTVMRGNDAVLTAIPNTEYKFLYWERTDGTQHEDNPYTLVKPTRDYSFIAKFRARAQYTVTTMVAPNTAAGTVTTAGLHENGKALEDATITLTAVAGEGYRFAEWQNATGQQVGTDAVYTFTATANVVYKAVFEEIPTTQYTVTLLRDPVEGGRIFGDGDYDENTEATIRATANAGYTFEGWYAGTTKVTSDNPYKFMVTADVTYTAKFTEKPIVDVDVTVRLGATVDATVGTVTGAGSYEKGKTVTLTATPASEDYIFSGWRDLDNDDELISSANPFTFTVTKDVHYAAVFREKFEVTLNILPDDNAGTLTGAGPGREGYPRTITATPSEGYLFVGWYDEDDNMVTNETSYTFTLQGNVTYTAKFEEESEDDYTITLKKLPNNDAGTVKGNGRYGFSEEVTLTATPAENYLFVAWLKPKADDPTQYDTVSKKASYKVTVTGDATYTALFRVRARYNIEVDIVPNDNAGTVTGDGEYREGRMVTLEATPNAGYVFVAWVLVSENPSPKDTVSRTETYTFTASKSATYKAVFKKTQAKYTLNLTVSPAAGGTVTGDGIYSANQTVTVTATPNFGYTFVGWRLLNGNVVSRDMTYTFQISRDMTLTAVFTTQVQYRVLLNVSPVEAGTVTGAGVYAENAEVTIAATANEGYTFTEWQDAEGATVTSEASYTFTATANVTYTAVFTKNETPDKEYTIDLNVMPDRNAGRVTGAGTYKEGALVSIVATANSGYTFVQWQDAAGRMLSDQATYTFKATANVIYTALFEKNVDSTKEYTVTLNVLPNLNAGSVKGNGVYKGGDMATITATPATGYKFVAWLNGPDTLSKNASYTFMVAADVTYAALFAEATANEQQMKAAFNVGAGNGKLYIENINDVVVKDVTVFNTVGRRVAHFAPNRRGNLTLPVNAACSVLVVRVVSEQGAGVYKVYLH